MDSKERANTFSKEIIGAAIEVHSTLGPGLLESAYLASLCHELNLRGVLFEKEVALPVKYKGVQLDAGYRMDLLVERQVVVEIKTVERIQPIHQAQLLTYLKLTGLWLGILLNFNVLFLKHGIRRVVSG